MRSESTTVVLWPLGYEQNSTASRCVGLNVVKVFRYLIGKTPSLTITSIECACHSRQSPTMHAKLMKLCEG